MKIAVTLASGQLDPSIVK